jgi:fused signal recognition particle receptor
VNNLLIGLVVVAVLAVLAFVFLRKKDEPEAIEHEEPKPLPKPAAQAKKEPAPKAEAKASPTPKVEKPAAKKEEAPRKSEAPAAAKRDERDEEEESDDEDVEIAAEPEPRKEPAGASRPPRVSAPPANKRPKDVAGLRKGLAKARETEGFFGRLKALFAGKKEIDPQIVEQIEEVLLTSDVGVKTTQMLVDTIKDALAKNELKDEARVWEALRSEATEILGIGGGGIALSAKPTVVMVVGVNGVGKTTTIGKLATRLQQQGKKVVLAAGDTFRAAAVQQLVVWGKRVGCEVVSGAEGANAGAVIFDAIQKAKDTGADVVLADTAGRLHTKTNLMEELKKIQRTMGKALDGAPHETLLVLDATNGQNATQQAALFKEALPLSGIVLTKLDGTAKGGVILGICAEHEVPVRYIGIGERAEDLRDFHPEEFVEALLGSAQDSTEEAA